MTLEEAREKFLNQRVRIKDAIGKSSWKGENDIVGILKFLGYNEYIPEWGLCATINRFPIQHVKLENIILEPKEN
jgi:hypothetical protein